MAVSPNPKTLLLPDPDAIPSVLGDKIIPAFTAALGFFAIFVSRLTAGRPKFSGIQQYLLWTVSGGVIGKLSQDRYDKYNMDRDAVYRHYIDLHPDDFPMPERKKFGELFNVWTPIR